MKNRLIAYGLMVLLLLAGSCKDSFLEPDAPSSPKLNDLYKTDSDFRNAIVGVYDALQDLYRNLWIFTELRADNADHRWTGFENVAVMDQFRNSNSEGFLNDTWLGLYRAIDRANLITEKLPLADPAKVPNAGIYEGEARFLRALAYYHLTMIWGDVPLFQKSPSLQEAYQKARTPKAQVLDAIVQDLQQAVSLLPVRYGSAGEGRATQGAAKALLGKVHLTRNDFTQAETVLREVGFSGTYDLLSDYNAVFNHNNEHHKEYIFDIEYQEGSGEGSNFTNQFIPNHADLRRQYAIAGISSEQMSPTDEFISLFVPEDKRAPISFATTYRDAAGTARRANHPYTLKYITATTAPNDSKVNWKVLRYADVLLMLAEALNENGKQGEALTELNKVRARAGVSLYQGLSQAALREAIAKERRLELAFEGHRWYDLVRTGKVYEEMSAKKYPIRPNMNLFPIPQQQLDIIRNPEVLAQNPGY